MKGVERMKDNRDIGLIKLRSDYEGSSKFDEEDLDDQSDFHSQDPNDLKRRLSKVTLSNNTSRENLNSARPNIEFEKIQQTFKSSYQQKFDNIFSQEKEFSEGSRIP